MKKNGFTLVELIIVITILAILGTITYISLQGITLDAHISKLEKDNKILKITNKKCKLDKDINTCIYMEENRKCIIDINNIENGFCVLINKAIIDKKKLCIELGGEIEKDYNIGTGKAYCLFVLNKGTFDFKLKKVDFNHLKYINYVKK